MTGGQRKRKKERNKIEGRLRSATTRRGGEGRKEKVSGLR